jgi:hypothetical protein
LTSFLMRLTAAPVARLRAWKLLVWSEAGMPKARRKNGLLFQAYAD